MNYCGFNIEPFCSDVCGDYRRPQTLAEICRVMGIYCDFREVAARGKYLGFMLLQCKNFAYVSQRKQKRVSNDRAAILKSKCVENKVSVYACTHINIHTFIVYTDIYTPSHTHIYIYIYVFTSKYKILCGTIGNVFAFVIHLRVCIYPCSWRCVMMYM